MVREGYGLGSESVSSYALTSARKTRREACQSNIPARAFNDNLPMNTILFRKAKKSGFDLL